MKEKVQGLKVFFLKIYIQAILIHQNFNYRYQKCRSSQSSLRMTHEGLESTFNPMRNCL